MSRKVFRRQHCPPAEWQRKNGDWSCRGKILCDEYCLRPEVYRQADFVDLRNQNPTPDCLHPDTSIGYPAGQELADEIRKGGHNGIVYPSARHANGVCLAAFWPGLIQNFRQGESWILKWAGSPTPTITKAANAA